jgi:hypothetical protein
LFPKSQIIDVRMVLLPGGERLIAQDVLQSATRTQQVSSTYDHVHNIFDGGSQAPSCEVLEEKLMK